MKRILNLSAAVILSTIASASLAGDAAAGISNISAWPNLAGQKELYLGNALKMYRDGHRENTMMYAMAKNLTDADIANLAAYYTGLK